MVRSDPIYTVLVKRGEMKGAGQGETGLAQLIASCAKSARERSGEGRGDGKGEEEGNREESEWERWSRQWWLDHIYQHGGKR